MVSPDATPSVVDGVKLAKHIVGSALTSAITLTSHLGDGYPVWARPIS